MAGYIYLTACNNTPDSPLPLIHIDHVIRTTRTTRTHTLSITGSDCPLQPNAPHSTFSYDARRSGTAVHVRVLPPADLLIETNNSVSLSTVTDYILVVPKNSVLQCERRVSDQSLEQTAKCMGGSYKR